MYVALQALLVVLSLSTVSSAHAADSRTAAAPSAASSDAFPRARARGTLIVGVPYLAPEPVAGAKIRTPERLDGVMADRLGQALGLPVKLVQIDATQRASALSQGNVDVLIADRSADDGQPAIAEIGDATAISTGYIARPKAVIRGDTRLRDWKDAKGLTVCMSTAAFPAQALAQQWGATVRPYRVPSDALVAVREGSCDIGLVDDIAWTPLMKFPEWKKFSATLSEQGPRTERVWIIPNDAATQTWLTAAMSQWRRDGIIQAMVNKWARDVAFDVYLDQEVPDCHGG